MKEKIVLVDDDPKNTRMLGMFFSRDYEFIPINPRPEDTAEEIAQAVKSALGESEDVVIIFDHSLDGLNETGTKGWQVIAILVEAGLPINAMLGLWSGEVQSVKAPYEQYGVRNFWEKPMDSPKIRPAIEKHFNSDR